MNWLTRILRQFGFLARRDQVNRDLEEEMSFHRAQAEREFIAQGMSPGDARYAAARQFGGRRRVHSTPVGIYHLPQAHAGRRGAHRDRPTAEPAPRAVTSARSRRSPAASSTTAGPAACRLPKMSVADAGIVAGEESGSFTTR